MFLNMGSWNVYRYIYLRRNLVAFEVAVTYVFSIYVYIYTIFSIKKYEAPAKRTMCN